MGGNSPGKGWLMVLCLMQATRVLVHAEGKDAALASSEPTPVHLRLNRATWLPAAGSAAGVWFYADRQSGAQVLFTGHAGVPGSWRLTAALPAEAEVRLEFGSGVEEGRRLEYRTRRIAVPQAAGSEEIECRVEPNALLLRSGSAAGAMALTDFSVNGVPASFAPRRRPYSRGPVEDSPELHPAIAEALVEWDWRMQDGIETPRERRTYAEATAKNLRQLEKLVAERTRLGSLSVSDEASWRALRRSAGELGAAAGDDARWLAVHRWRRQFVLGNPLFRMSSLLFVKHVPSVMSHQLTQVYGYCARPGGGLFELVAPGNGMQTRNLTPASLPAGNFMTPELDYDADRILFAYCPVQEAPASWDFNEQTRGQRYHLYELSRETGAVRALTQGDTDNFSPVRLPSGDILFLSTRRGGYHRCGRGPCFVYTLSRMDADGGNPRSVSFHETQEWDPCLLNDGRVIYTRWDYVDRNAVHYEQLWSALPDGGGARIYYGNNTWNPTGIWEARAIPGSSRVMATAAPHHGMSAGSVVLLDPSQGVDGLAPLRRLTPDVRFPESEEPLAHGAPPAVADFDTPVAQFWKSPLVESGGVIEPTEEERRWPGHCYKSPWPLSEDFFVVSYSFDRLVGEPGPNVPNMFGLYFADAFGNKELIYRDPAISSLWARPVARRNAPQELATTRPGGDSERGTFFLQDVRQGWPYLPTNRPITALRIVQVLLKTTPHSDSPRVGAAFAAPGKQVLGTVPVESDGSALFEVPARMPVLFQALDAEGRAVQTMRSLVYLQPGEHQSCVGCHEHRQLAAAVDARLPALALRRAPSRIRPGPDGSRPFSYPRLVQPVLDRHCVRCHDGKDAGRSVLTGEPEGDFSKSYNALVRWVSFSAWNRPENNFEPLTAPLRFGTLGSALPRFLEASHGDGTMRLNAEDRERLHTWMDANALFYGTFDVAEQRKQLVGLPIEGPME
ncbi:MAG: hypothetical protein IT581_23085 [Verrucomicrobiales bacterium]|nr:hypothetical protein [Verrucomicrobiales bacterium]